MVIKRSCVSYGGFHRKATFKLPEGQTVVCGDQPAEIYPREKSSYKNVANQIMSKVSP